MSKSVPLKMSIGILVLVLITLVVCIPLKAFAESHNVCNENVRATLYSDTNRDDPTTYYEQLYLKDDSYVKNISLKFDKGVVQDVYIRLTFDSYEKSFFGKVKANFVLCVANENGKVLGRYSGDCSCLRNRNHYIDFGPNNCTDGNRNAIAAFYYDAKNGGHVYHAYVESVDLNN